MMNTGHEASILRKRIRTLLTDVLRYSSAERLTPSHPLVLSMEKEEPYRISSEYLLLLRKTLTTQQLRILVQRTRSFLIFIQYLFPDLLKNKLATRYTTDNTRSDYA